MQGLDAALSKVFQKKKGKKPKKHTPGQEPLRKSQKCSQITVGNVE